MNKKKYVTFRQARMLKELGYNEPCIYHYEESGALCPNRVPVKNFPVLYVSPEHLFRCNFQHCEERCSAPTLHEASDWLIGKGLYVCPRINGLDKWFAEVIDTNTVECIYTQPDDCEDYYSALSHGIDYCLGELKYNKKQ